MNNKIYTTGIVTLEAEHIGSEVLVFNKPGEDPIIGKIASIDTLTNLVLSVLITDKDKRDKIINTKSKIVQFIFEVNDVVEEIKPIVQKSAGLFKRIFKFFKDLF